MSVPFSALMIGTTFEFLSVGDQPALFRSQLERWTKTGTVVYKLSPNGGLRYRVWRDHLPVVPHHEEESQDGH